MRFIALLVFYGLTVTAAAAPLPLDRLALPPGFDIGIYTNQVPSARAMTLGEHGTVFVGSMAAGKVYALTDADANGHADRVRVVASGLSMPVGVAFHAGDLYISAVDRIVVLRDIESRLANPPEPQIITDRLPARRHHGWRFIGFGPDGRLYVAVGAPCNVCAPQSPFATIISMQPDGSDWRIIARGVRNSVGFDWQPTSGKLWFTDNGRDMLGDNRPSDELNRVDHTGAHFGYPYCHAGDIPDPEHSRDHNCDDYVPPVLKLGAHVAALGMRFYTGDMFPARYHGAIFMAQHGSWNRSAKVGYRVMTVRVEADKVLAYEPLVAGFEHDEKAWGRPVDVLPMPDGSLLISDDKTGAIYRVIYRPDTDTHGTAGPP